MAFKGPYNLVYLINSAVITRFGLYRYRPVKPEEIQRLTTWVDDEGKRRWKQGVISAVGHELAARILSEIIGKTVKVNRIRIAMKAGDKAIVLRLRFRLPEGVVIRDLRELGDWAQSDEPYELGILERIE